MKQSTKSIKPRQGKNQRPEDPPLEPGFPTPRKPPPKRFLILVVKKKYSPVEGFNFRQYYRRLQQLFGGEIINIPCAWIHNGHKFNSAGFCVDLKMDIREYLKKLDRPETVDE